MKHRHDYPQGLEDTPSLAELLKDVSLADPEVAHNQEEANSPQ